MALSIGNLIHRALVYGCVGFGAYGTIVIAQNMVVKSRQIKEINDQMRQEATVNDPAAAPVAAPELKA